MPFFDHLLASVSRVPLWAGIALCLVATQVSAEEADPLAFRPAPQEITAPVAGEAPAVRTIVQPQAQTFNRIGSKEIQQAVAAELVRQGAGDRIEASLNVPADNIEQGATALFLEIAQMDFDAQSRKWNAQVNILTGDAIAKTMNLQGRFHEMTDVPVLTHRLQKDEVIEEDDIAWLSIPSHRLRKDTATSDAELIGQSPRRVISENRPVRLSELMAPVAMRKGSTVTLRFQSESLQITTSGQALDDAAIGDTVRVLNTASGVTVQGSVVNPNEVAVQSPARVFANNERKVR